MSSFILESAIYQEAKIIKSDPSKAIFRCTIQTVDEVNQNNRLYPSKVLIEAMKSCDGRMKRRSFLNELDHPLLQGNEEFDAIRQTTVSLKEVSHLIRDYEFRKNYLIGEMETTSTPNGAILLGLLRDKSGIGFSMRGLAELTREKDYSIVTSPLTIIAFDAVSMPSHSAAVVDFNEMRFESSYLVEETGLVCINGKCFLPDYFDRLIESKCITFFEKWV